jgi:hypothetical protein
MSERVEELGVTSPTDDSINSMEVKLVGQTNQGVVRIGKTVHRKTEPWSPAVHELLRHLESVNFKYSPRLLGLDEQGREVLSYFDGESGKEAWAKVISDNGLQAFAKLLRSYHDSVKSFEPKNNNWALTSQGPNQDEIVCHGDFGPWNTVWQGQKPVAILDWDFAGPSPALYDIAYALEYVAPFRDDEECIKWLAYPKPPDRRHRIQVFAKAYRLDSTAGLVDAVINVQQAGIEHVRSLAEKGQQPQLKWVQDGHLDELAKRVAWSKTNRHLFD